jgi:Protein of unknown function (DUF4239)
MAKWLAAEAPEWLVLLVFAGGLPGLMLVFETWVHRWAPHWRRGEHNDATGIMLSSAAVVYSVAMGLCVVTLWEERNDASRAVEAEALNLAAVAEGGRVFDSPVRERIQRGVLDYNQDVLDSWPERIQGEASPTVSTALDDLVATVAALRPSTEAQRAYVTDATNRLARETELRALVVRLARDQQLPDTLWVSVLAGSAVVLALCLTCGIRDGALRRILVSGVAVTVGVNLFLVVELNYPFYGNVRVRPDSYQAVVADLRQSR